MSSNAYEIEVAPAGHDLPFKLVGGLAAACFIGALVCDLVYVSSPDFMWVTFSVWLITCGLVIAGVAMVVGLIDRLVHDRFRAMFAYWPYLIGFFAVFVVSLFNAFVHSRDAYEAVVPDGLTLSIVAVALLVLTPLFGRAITRTRFRKASL
jgi:uncharacterized membrane protein